MPDLNITALNNRLQAVLELHLDAQWGSAYWLGRQQELGFDICREIQTVSDLSRLGSMNQELLATKPIHFFVPKKLHDELDDCVLGQTGGTLGRPIWTVYTHKEFEEAFVTPFVEAARHVGFPTEGSWLYVAPSGPHIMGQAARALARAHGMLEPFTVDFDPRWAKKLPSGSFAAKRYLNHVVEQALSILNQQEISILFTTPSVLEILALRMDPAQRELIRGIHYGGQPVTRQQINSLKNIQFPEAVHLSGYGNTLFGCCLELDITTENMVYYPYGSRSFFEPACDSEEQRSGEPDTDCRGRNRLVVSRFDESMLLINLAERDLAKLRENGSVPGDFQARGIVDPQDCFTSSRPRASGLY